jgi:hypothetical protein
MAKFITSINLQEATERDYAKLSQELKKYFFSPANRPGKSSGTSLVFNSSESKSLLDTTSAITRAAATTGRKFSFTVIREKAKPEFK